jgi:hypothetical protein
VDFCTAAGTLNVGFLLPLAMMCPDLLGFPLSLNVVQERIEVFGRTAPRRVFPDRLLL